MRGGEKIAYMFLAGLRRQSSHRADDLPRYFLIDLFGGINPRSGDNVAHFAHVGGAIIGLILVITMNKSNRRTFY
jgi:membrane associated rhomboid family serine protease